jgi:DNA-binding FadR family transcriptional regulator
MDRPTTTERQRIGSVVDLRPASPVPLYYQLAQSITQAVRCGVLLPGTILGPVRVVAEELRMSRNTVRHAMDLLNGDNVIRPASDGCHVVVAQETPDLPSRPGSRQTARPGTRRAPQQTMRN